jgi:hypothetical protein
MTSTPQTTSSDSLFTPDDLAPLFTPKPDTYTSFPILYKNIQQSPTKFRSLLTARLLVWAHLLDNLVIPRNAVWIRWYVRRHLYSGGDEDDNARNVNVEELQTLCGYDREISVTPPQPILDTTTATTKKTENAPDTPTSNMSNITNVIIKPEIMRDTSPPFIRLTVAHTRVLEIDVPEQRDFCLVGTYTLHSDGVIVYETLNRNIGGHWHYYQREVVDIFNKIIEVKYLQKSHNSFVRFLTLFSRAFSVYMDFLDTHINNNDDSNKTTTTVKTPKSVDTFEAFMCDSTPKLSAICALIPKATSANPSSPPPPPPSSSPPVINGP